jgi:hypothetical protein
MLIQCVSPPDVSSRETCQMDILISHEEKSVYHEVCETE